MLCISGFVDDATFSLNGPTLSHTQTKVMIS